MSAATTAEPVSTASARGLRIPSIDMLRGLVIVLMALDHVRDFWSRSHGDPLDLGHPDLALFFTRWVTNFCAPTFVLLAGVSAYLQTTQGKTTRQLAMFLATRGLWLIALDLLVVSPSWAFRFGELNLQVLWAIGWGMLTLAALAWAPRRAVLGLGVAIMVGHNLLDPIKPAAMGALAPVWMFLHVAGGPFSVAPGVTALVLYPVMPWIGLICIGFGLGFLFEMEQVRRRRLLLMLGLALSAAFVVVRILNVYGDPHPWRVELTPLRTFLGYLKVEKYPPSLLYGLATGGPALMLLAFLEQPMGLFGRVAQTYGRVPTFFYLIHVPIIHGLALATGLAMGASMQNFVGLFGPDVASPWGVDLGGVYLIWVAIVAGLYLPCLWWGDLKRRHSAWWLSYL